MVRDGWAAGGLNHRLVQGVLNIGFTVFVIASVIVILSQAITRWVSYRQRIDRPTATPVS